MAKIAIDIDNTLYDFGSEIREVFFDLAVEEGDKNLLRGAYHAPFEWRDLSDLFEWEVVDKAIQKVHDAALDQVPYKGAVRVVQRLGEKHDIKYVTSRYEHHYKATDTWLFENGFPQGELICSTHDKSDHLVDCQYLIDDRVKTLIEFVTDHGWENYHFEKDEARKAFSLWHHYNRNLTDVKNIYLAPTWRGLEYYLEKKDVL
jgi:uncharacterized HAD superfamily protein